MSRGEVAAVRLHFSRSVDRYAERRRQLVREARRIAARARDGDGGGESGGGDGADRDGNRERTSTSGSANSLLAGDGGDDGDDGGDDGPAGGVGPGGDDGADDRLRMEDEWMSVQGPYSEFRMNLNTSDPLLLAAIGGGRTGGGLFFRGGALPLTTGADDGEGGDGVFGAHGAGGVGSAGGRLPYGPYGTLAPAGTDKDYVWGFILGFFMGFIMLFWVWLPTVPHRQVSPVHNFPIGGPFGHYCSTDSLDLLSLSLSRSSVIPSAEQKLGIISGISFQLGLKLLRNEGGDDVPAV